MCDSKFVSDFHFGEHKAIFIEISNNAANAKINMLMPLR